MGIFNKKCKYGLMCHKFMKEQFHFFSKYSLLSNKLKGFYTNIQNLRTLKFRLIHMALPMFYQDVWTMLGDFERSFRVNIKWNQVPAILLSMSCFT